MVENIGMQIEFGSNAVKLQDSIKGVNVTLRALRDQFKTLKTESYLSGDSTKGLQSQLKNLQNQATVAREKLTQLKAEQDRVAADKGVNSTAWIRLQGQIEKTTRTIMYADKAVDDMKTKMASQGNANPLGAITNSVDILRERLQTLKLDASLNGANTANYRSQLAALTNQATNLSGKLRVLQREQASELQGSGGVQTSRWMELNREIEQTKRDLLQVNAEIKTVNSSISAINPTPMRRFAQTMQQQITHVKNFGNKMTDVGQRMGNNPLGLIATNKALSVTSDLMGQSIKDAQANADAMRSFENAMDVFHKPAAEIAAAKKELKNYADVSKYDLSESMGVATQFAANGVKGYVELTESVMNLGAQMGTTTDQQKSINLALTQSMSIGKLNTENYNQLAEANGAFSGALKSQITQILKAKGVTGNWSELLQTGAISSDVLTQALNKLGQSQQAIAAGKQIKTLDDAMGQLHASLADTATALAGVFGRTPIQLISDIAGKIDQLNKWINNHKALLRTLLPIILTLVAAVAGFAILGTILAPIGAMISMFASFVSFIPTLVTAIGAIGAVIGTISLPVVAVVGVIVGLIALCVIFHKQIAAFFVQLWGWLSSLGGAVGTAFGGMFSAIGSFFSGFVVLVNNIIGAIGNAIRSIVSVVLGFVGGLVKGLIEVVVGSFVILGSTILNFIKSIANLFMPFINVIVGVVRSIVNGVINIVTSSMGQAVARIVGGFINMGVTIARTIAALPGYMANALMQVLSVVIGFVGRLVSAGFDLGRNFVTSIVRGLAGIGSAIWNAISRPIASVASVGRQAINSVLGKGVGLQINPYSMQTLTAMQVAGGGTAGQTALTKAIGDTISSSNRTNTNNIHVNVSGANADPREIASEVERIIVNRIS